MFIPIFIFMFNINININIDIFVFIYWYYIFIFIVYIYIYITHFLSHSPGILELCSSCLFFVKQSAWSERKKIARHSHLVACIIVEFLLEFQSICSTYADRSWILTLLGRREVFGAVATLAFYDGHLGATGHNTRHKIKQHERMGYS